MKSSAVGMVAVQPRQYLCERQVTDYSENKLRAALESSIVAPLATARGHSGTFPSC